MKITVINGINHKGSTWHAAEELIKNIADPKEVTEFFLPKDLNHFCNGCYACIKAKENCPYWDEKAVIDKALEEADLLIFTTPTYCMMPSGSMKAFMDLFFKKWMSHTPSETMFSKRAVVISTAAGAGAKKAVKPIKTMLQYWGVPWICTYGMAVAASNWEEMPERNKVKILWDMKRIGQGISAAKGKPHVGIKIRFIFRLMSGMTKKGYGAGPEEKAYWEERGWLDGKKPWK